ncbi:MAG: sodium/proline symporter [Halodesulfurarchaeum sp.]
MPEAIAGAAGPWVLGTFALYLVVLIVIGVWSSSLLETVGDFVIGGRRVGPVVTGFSERASEMSGWLTLGVPANAFTTGIMAFMNAAVIPFDLGSWAFLAKRLRKYSEIVKAVTLPTFFETRLQDDSGWVKAVSSLVLIIFEGGYVGAQIVAAGTLLRVLTGVDMWVGIIAGGIIVVGYTMLGGYFAVAWTDYFQGAIILVGFIILPIIAFLNFGLPFNDLATVDGGATMSSITAGMTGWAAVFGIISYVAIGLGWPGNPHIMVRFMGIDRVKNIRKAAAVAQLFMFAAYAGAVMIGLYAITQLGSAVAKPDNAMPMLTLELLPGALAGIILAAALAAMMSSADSQLLVATSAVVEDIYHGFLNKQATNDQLVRYSRYVTLLLGLASIAFAYFARSTPIYTLVLDYAWGGLGASLGPMLIATLWWKRLTAKGAIASMVTGTVTMILWTQWSTILGQATIDNMGPFLNGLFTVYGLFPAFVISALVMIVVSYLTEPPDQSDVDDHFEVMRKPLSAVIDEEGESGDTPGYIADGGVPQPKTVTEMDNMRTHVTDSDYWKR